MKKDLRDKLGKYTALAGAMISTGGLAHAQGIIYTEANDTLVSDSTAVTLFDLNQDGMDDFGFILYNVTYGGNPLNVLMAGPYGSVGNAVAGTVPSGYNYPTKFNNGDTIDANVDWLPDNSVGTMVWVYNGTNPYNENWQGGVTDGYLGLKLKSGTETYYGWARLDVNADATQVILKDFAVYVVDGEGIAAGQTEVVSVRNYEIINTEVYASGKNVYVTLPQELSRGDVRITNILGQVVYEGSIENNSQQIIELNDQKTGMYVITIESNGDKFVKKIMLN